MRKSVSLESPGQLAAVCYRGGDGSLVTNELSGDLCANDAAAVEMEGAGERGAEGERQDV